MLTTAAHTAAPFVYVDCDVPEGQTLTEWRHARTPARRRRPHLHLPTLRSKS